MHPELVQCYRCELPMGVTCLAAVVMQQRSFEEKNETCC